MKHAFNKGVLSSKVGACLLASSVLFAAGQAWALTAAGTDIKNKATVTYEDSNGNSYSAQSNEAVVTVAPVYAATLEDDGTKSGAAGEIVYFTHVLTNTGNTSDTYSLDGLTGHGSGGTAGSYQVYVDGNNNGLPDAGEVATTSVSLNAGQQAQLILAVPVPSGTAAGTAINATLLARSSQGNGLVDDIGADGDSEDDTNNVVINVTADAVLVVNKSATVNTATNEITYTLEVKNNGARPANDVVIWDAIPANASFVQMVSVNGLLGSNGDQWLDNNDTWQNLPNGYAAVANLTTVDEPAGVDMNGNGTPGETGLSGIAFRDAVMGVNTTVSIVYRVSFDPNLASGTQIRNVFAAQGDLDEDGNEEPPVPSQPVTTTIAQFFDVVADDTDGANGDADADNDTFLVDSAASGATVTFFHNVTNAGNGSDVLELRVFNDAGAGHAEQPGGAAAFPAGTTFTLWNAAGSVQLTDTNGDGNADTGVLGASGNQVFTVKAKLPAGFSGTGPYAYTLRATSANDVGSPAASDDTLGVLTAINAPAVDLANTIDATGMGDSLVDADAYANGVVTTLSAAVGGTVTFDLFLANESGSAQSYNLSAPGLPAGWSVVFRATGVDVNGNGSLLDPVDNTSMAGNVVTSTPSLPAGAIFAYTAEVTVSPNAAQAPAGTQNIEFRVEAASNASIFDRKLDAVTVLPNRVISVTPDGSNQVQPGGNVDYPHVLTNNGNSTETVELTATNLLAGDGWSNTTVAFVGAGCTATALTNLPLGSPIVLCDAAGNPVSVTIADSDSDTYPEITLTPGQSIRLRATVFAPSSAAQGAQDVLTLAATNMDGAAPATASSSATDSTEVILGQVRLFKRAGVDADCGCADGSNWTPDTGFAEVQTTQVAPGECVIWQLRATNEGAATAYNVTVTDEVTPFTTLENTDNACVDSVDGNNCAPSAGAIANSGVAPVVEWTVGDLLSGDTARTRFCVSVD